MADLSIYARTMVRSLHRKRFENGWTTLKSVPCLSSQGALGRMDTMNHLMENLEMSLLNGEIFYTLAEAKIIIERWASPLQYQEAAYQLSTTGTRRSLYYQTVNVKK